MQATSRSLKELFLAALEIAPSERPDWLERECADLDLRERLERMLAAHDAPHSLLDAPAPSRVPTIDEPISEGPGTLIGPYKLLEQIGEGGMGLVFVAEQQHPIRRKVALKVIKPGMDTRQVIARFEAERQALALMDHPNIAKVHDGGATPSGRPYFIMELVKGVPITEYCDQNQVPIGRRLELFLDVCHAVQHAHQKGIIHRDIKPSNVLVMSHDGTPAVKVIDFGVAKAIGQQLTDKTVYTQFAQLIGTPLYMSPEQAGESSVDVDTRSDIYSLGVLLYELLTGTTPFDKERLHQVGFDEMRRIIREEEPPRPSTRISTMGQAGTTASTNRRSDPKQLSRLVRGDLDWIVMKALEKDRNRRYETASAFAADVQRYLHDEPVLACPPSVAYRWRKFARRHKAALWTTAAVSLVLALAAGGIVWTLWDRTARSTATERTVSVALAKTGQLADQARQMPSAGSGLAEAALVVWQQAEDALAQAEAALRTGVADDGLRQQVAAMRTELAEGRQQTEQARDRALRKEKLFRDLDDARMARSAVVGNEMDNAGAAAKFAEAFEAYGLGRKAHYGSEGTADQIKAIVRQIRAEEPEVRDALLMALDDWAYSAERLPKEWRSASGLTTIAQMADDNPWRNKCRFAILKSHLGRHLHAAEVRSLSAEAQRLMLPPSSLCILAMRLEWVGEFDECVALLRWGRRRHPSDFWIHLYLGDFLLEKKGPSPVELEEAIGCYLAALALRPHTSVAYYGLGRALKAQGKLDEAIHAFGESIWLDAQFAGVHYELGIAFYEQGRHKEAEAALRESIRIKPDFAHAYRNLGVALVAQSKLTEAEDAYRAAIRLQPDYAEAHCHLGHVLGLQGRFSESLAAYRRGHELGSKQPGWRHPSSEWVREAEQLVVLDAKLPRILKGEVQPAGAGECLAIARLCQMYKKLNAEAARFYTEAFAADPKLADDLRSSHRYNAASAAALAGCGQGENTAKPNEQEQARLRQQALDWLRADLTAWRQLLGKEPGQTRAAVQRTLRHWKQDADFAGLRGDALARLPEAERAPWQQLWADVEQTLKEAIRNRAEETNKKPSN
jgi:serine/threonine protein kinase/tetratricopeptide (TPR) repeat protein